MTRKVILRTEYNTGFTTQLSREMLELEGQANTSKALSPVVISAVTPRNKFLNVAFNLYCI